MKHISCFLFVVIVLNTACNDANSDIKGRKDLLDPAKIVHNPNTLNGITKEDAAKLPVLTFTDTTHSFGTINEGEKVTYDFAFRNDGKSPLLIEGAEGSCGCTVADYPREPLAPGKSAMMKVIFSSAGKQGHQEKDVAINANTARGLYHLHIDVDVVPQKN